jgi:hypothetical protein
LTCFTKSMTGELWYTFFLGCNGAFGGHDGVSIGLF